MNRRGPGALERVEFPRAAACVRNLRGDARDARQRAEHHAPLLVRAQRDGLRARKFAVLDREDRLLVGERLAVASEQLEDVIVAELREVAVARKIGALDSVQCPSVARRDVAFLAARAEHVHFSGERDGQLCEPLGNAEVMHEHAARGEFQALHFARRRDAVVRRRGDREFRLREHRGIKVRLADHQRGAHGERRLAACEELLALDVEFRIERVGLRVMLELRERRKRALGIRDDDRPHAGLRRERHHDASELLVAHELASVEPCDRVLHLRAALVNHREHVAARPGALQHLPLPRAHERAAAAPAADELHDPRAAFALQRGKFERLPRALERPAVERVRLLAVRHEAVEIHVRVELAVLRGEKIQRIHLVDFHDDLRRVLHHDIELHIVARVPLARGLEERRIRRRELDVHALLQPLKFRGCDQRSPLLGIPLAARDERLCEHRFHPSVAHIVRVWRHHSDADVAEILRGGALPDGQEIIPHERLVIVHRRSVEQGIAEVLVEIRERHRVARALEPFRIHIMDVAGELEVFEEARRVIHALLSVVFEAEVKCARLQRVEDRWQRLHVRRHADQPRLALGRVELDVHIRRRRELAQFCKDERLLRRKAGDHFCERVELRGQQRAVDVEFAEPARFLRLQIERDEFHDPRHIGPCETREQCAPLLEIELRAIFHQRLQRLLGEAAEAAIIRERVALENVARHALRIERRRQVRLFVTHLLLMVELQTEPLAQIRERLLRSRIVREQRLAVQDDPPLRALAGETLAPLVEDVRELCSVARVLKMQRVEKIIVLGAGDEFAEHLRAIRREREFLDEADLILRPRTDGQDERGDEGDCRGEGVA